MGKFIEELKSPDTTGMPPLVFNAVFFFFFSSSPCEDIFSLLLEREEGGERNIDVKEKHQFFLPPIHAQTRDRTCYLGMCLHWESNPQPFGYGMMIQPTEPHRPGPRFFLERVVTKRTWLQAHLCLWREDTWRPPAGPGPNRSGWWETQPAFPGAAAPLCSGLPGAAASVPFP